MYSTKSVTLPVASNLYPQSTFYNGIKNCKFDGEITSVLNTREERCIVQSLLLFSNDDLLRSKGRSGSG